MKINNMWLLPGLLAVLAAGAAQAAPPRTCDPTAPCPDCCSLDEFPLYVQPGQHEPGNGTLGEDIIIGDEDPCSDPVCGLIVVPPVAQLACHHESAVVHCEAWPRTLDPAFRFSYRWAEGDQAPGSPPADAPEEIGTVNSWTDDHSAAFRCANTKVAYVHVDVTVRSPYGLESSTSMLVPCIDE